MKNGVWIAAIAIFPAASSVGCAFWDGNIPETGGPGWGGSGQGTGGGPIESGGTGVDGGDGNSTGGSANDDAGATFDGGTTADGAMGGTAHLRFISGSAFAGKPDFCLRLHDDTNTAPFDIGPVLSSRGVTTGLATSSATVYFDFPAGQYDVLLLHPNAADCTAVLDPVRSNLRSFPLATDGSWWSMIFAQFGNNSFTTLVRQDEHDAVGGQVRLRFLNTSAYPTPPVSFGLRTADAFTLLFSDVPQYALPTGPDVDALGYVTINSVSGATAVVRRRPDGPDVSQLPDVQLAPGEVVTVLSGSAVGDSPKICHDMSNAPGPLIPCDVAP